MSFDRDQPRRRFDDFTMRDAAMGVGRVWSRQPPPKEQTLGGVPGNGACVPRACTSRPAASPRPFPAGRSRLGRDLHLRRLTANRVFGHGRTVAWRGGGRRPFPRGRPCYMQDGPCVTSVTERAAAPARDAKLSPVDGTSPGGLSHFGALPECSWCTMRATLSDLCTAVPCNLFPVRC